MGSVAPLRVSCVVAAAGVRSGVGGLGLLWLKMGRSTVLRRLTLLYMSSSSNVSSRRAEDCNDSGVDGEVDAPAAAKGG